MEMSKSMLSIAGCAGVGAVVAVVISSPAGAVGGAIFGASISVVAHLASHDSTRHITIAALAVLGFLTAAWGIISLYTTLSFRSIVILSCSTVGLLGIAAIAGILGQECHQMVRRLVLRQA